MGRRAGGERPQWAVRRIAAAAEARTLIMRLLSRICSFSVFLEAPMPIADYGFTTGGGRPLFARRSSSVSTGDSVLFNYFSLLRTTRCGGRKAAQPRTHWPFLAPHGAIDLALARRCCPGSMGVEAHAPFFSANSSHIL